MHWSEWEKMRCYALGHGSAHYHCYLYSDDIALRTGSACCCCAYCHCHAHTSCLHIELHLLPNTCTTATATVYLHYAGRQAASECGIAWRIPCTLYFLGRSTAAHTTAVQSCRHCLLKGSGKGPLPGGGFLPSPLWHYACQPLPAALLPILPVPACYLPLPAGTGSLYWQRTTLPALPQEVCYLHLRLRLRDLDLVAAIWFLHLPFARLR